MSFFDKTGDKRMANQNQPAWDAITKQVVASQDAGELPNRPLNILDWGCHEGGLLATMTSCKELRTGVVRGVEPDAEARQKAEQRLASSTGYFRKDLSEVPGHSVDILVSHEVLYLVELEWFFHQLKRVLRPGGAAFIALGSHTENTAWMRWREVLLKNHGHISYAHDPWEDIVKKGNEVGFIVGYDKLWPSGYPGGNWYSLPEEGWGEFLSMKEALAFRDAKILFQFWSRP